MSPRLLTLLLPVATAAGVAGWVRWLVRRRRVWFGRLNDAIPVHSAFRRERRSRSGELLYVALGDSAAQGIGASRPARGYVGVLARDIARRTGVTVRVANLSISGATVTDALHREVPLLRELEPDVCTLAIGANDIARWDENRFAAELAEVLDAVPPHTVVAELPSFYMLPGERSVRQANDILRRLAADRGLVVAPLYGITRRQGVVGIVTQFAGDLFHPNDRGYAVWAEAFRPAIERRVDELLAARAIENG